MGSRSDRNAAERALAEILADPGPLYHRQPEQEPIWLLFIYLDTLHVHKEFANSRFQIRLRYGDSGTYQEKSTQKVQSSAGFSEGLVQPGSVVQLHGFVSNQDLNGAVGICESWNAERERWHVRLSSGEVKAVQTANMRLAGEASASFGAMMIFRWSSHLAPTLTLDVLKLGFIDRVVSRTVMKLPFREGQPAIFEQELLLHEVQGSSGCFGGGSRKKRGGGAGGEDDDSLVGHIGVMVELRRLTLEEIRIGTGITGSLQELAMTLDMFISDPRYSGDMGGPTPYPGGRRQMRHENPQPHNLVAGTPVNLGSCPDVVVGRPVPGSGWACRNHPASVR
mmetsp:Transcript_34294/g.80165  ORF Transcript_34294/g.80165 Transcript_34294/m.80165 type:complete len:337 (+) Transcript_34294:65-1075(+)